MRRFLMSTIRLATFTAFAALTTIGCGNGGNNSMGTGATPLGADGAVPIATSGPYQPLVVGATWTYNVTDTGVAYVKNSSVLALEDVGGQYAGTMGYKVSETVKSSTQLTWYQQTDTDVRRLHDQQIDANGMMSSEDWYTPYDLRVDESADHTMSGAAWTLSYMDAHTTPTKPTSTTTITENWTTDAVNEVVTEPAGTFYAMKITRTNTADGTAKSQWFVQGVGKIRESNNTGHLEELTAYMIPSGGSSGGSNTDGGAGQ